MEQHKEVFDFLLNQLKELQQKIIDKINNFKTKVVWMPIFKIDDNLYQGSEPTEPLDLYSIVEKRRIIDAIVNLVSNEEPITYSPQVDAYIRLPIYDGPSPGMDWLKMAVGIVEHLRKKYSVLIHCHAGISRSSALTAAVLMKSKKWKKDKALEHIATINSKIDPASNFLRLLTEFEREIWK